MAVTVTLRFFAASRAATGLEELPRSFPDEPALGDLIAGLAPSAGTDPAELAAVLERCSFLVDGVSTRDRAQVIPADSVVDVMPPFAGG